MVAAARRVRALSTDGIWITELEPAGDGPRLAVKDLFDTAGIRTTYGSAIFRDHVPDTSAAAVVLLERAGYLNAGKSNLHEFAWGITSENPHYGTVPNPLMEGRVAGGSSGGSAAAIAAGLVDHALGSDSGGSIRIPSACCGTTGLKPTFGLVPIAGCFPLAPSFDHAGPMAADVAGCERMMEVLAADFQPAPEPDPADLVVGVAWLAEADPLVRERVEAVAARFPNTRALDLPFPDDVTPLFEREVAEVHADLWRDHRADYGENVARKLERAFAVEDAAAEAATHARELYRERIEELTAGCDVVLTPTMKMVAPPTGIGDLALRRDVVRLTLPWNVVGRPALALPCGPAEEGLPASVQIVGRHGDDALVLAAGRFIERSA